MARAQQLVRRHSAEDTVDRPQPEFAAFTGPRPELEFDRPAAKAGADRGRMNPERVVTRWARYLWDLGSEHAAGRDGQDHGAVAAVAVTELRVIGRLRDQGW